MDKQQNMETVLRDLLAEIERIKEFAQTIYPIVESCEEEGIYENLPETLQRIVKPTQEVMKIYEASNQRISEIGASDEDIDIKLRDLYCEIVGDLRNSLNPPFTLVEVCGMEKEQLPDKVRELVESAKEAKEEITKSNDRISEILGRLPKEKLQEYSDYHLYSKK